MDSVWVVSAVALSEAVDDSDLDRASVAPDRVSVMVTEREGVPLPCLFVYETISVTVPMDGVGVSDPDGSLETV